MKKNILILGLISLATLSLTACGSTKDYTMSFDEAVNSANHSALQDVLTSSENVQQILSLSTNIDNWANKMAITVQSDNKQNLWNQKSTSSTTFDVNINADDTNVLVKWNLDIRVLNNIIYLNLTSLDFSSSEDTSFLTSMTEWFKNQWFSIPLEWLNNMPSTFSYIKDAKSLNEQAKEIIINEGSTTYNWIFTQFNGYNAWKFSLDNEKLQQLINDYYSRINETLDEENKQEAPQLNIQNFKWYLIITWKDKITTVIENMEMVEWETNININWFWGDDYEINAFSNWESPILTIKATKKGSNYNVYINATDSIKLEWTITPKLSSSKIDVKFDATLTVKSEYEEADDSIIPLKGNWSYSPISDFDVIAPENAQDLTELLSAYLWSMIWTGDYGYAYDEYEDYNNEEINDGAAIEQPELTAEAAK